MHRKALLVVLLLCILQPVLSVVACCSLEPADFADTYGWAGEFEKDGRLMHVLLYENQPTNLAAGPNAMILPIPALAHSLNSSNMLDGHDFVGVAGELYKDANWHFFGDIDQALTSFGLCIRSLPKIIAFFFNLSKNLESAASASADAKNYQEPAVQVFSKGSYTVVLASSAADIPNALSRVPAERRPELNSEIFTAYDNWYPGWSFALCCFNRQDTKPEPLVWVYEPNDPTKIFFPGLDAHTGRAPVLNTAVAVDHKLVVSSNHIPWYSFAGPLLSSYKKIVSDALNLKPETVRAILPTRAMSRQFSGHLLQGDFIFSTEDVRAGIMRPERRNPEAVPNEKILVAADAVYENEGLFSKIIIGYFIAFFLLHLLGLHSQGNNIGWTTLILMVLVGLLLSAPALTVYEIKIHAIFRILIALAAMCVPVEIAVGRKPDIQIGCYLMLICLGAVLIFLPSYSSSWWPLAWGAVVLYAFNHRTIEPASESSPPTPPEAEEKPVPEPAA
jgi:hypothetical protein